MNIKKIIADKYHIVVLLFAVFVISLPAFRRGTCLAHDLPFHLGRIQAIAEELKNGQFPVRYETSAWYGHGYICTTMYGNIFLYIPSLLYLLGLPIWKVYNIYLLIVNIATIAVSYQCFKRIFNTKNGTLIATIVYCTIGYRMSNLYVRGSVGEYTAMIFIPLIIYGIKRIYEDEQKNVIGLIMPFVLGVTGIIQSHILTTELVAIFVLFYLVVNLKKTLGSIKSWIWSLILILLINLFFIIPFMDSYASMRLYANTELTNQSIRGDGLYLSQLFGLLTEGFGGSYMWATNDEGYLNSGLVFVLMVCISVVYIVVSKLVKNKSERIPFSYGILMIFGFVAMFMSTIYFPWDGIAKGGFRILASIQYPWRYMLIAMSCFTITGVYAIEKMIPSKSALVLLGLMVIVVLSTAYFDYTLVWKNTTITNQHADENWADKLYLPEGTDRDYLINTEVEVVDGIATIPTLAYDNVYVLDSQGHEIEWTYGFNNCIEVAADDIEDGYSVVFEEPIIWKISEIVSLFTVATLCGYMCIKKRLKIEL